MMIFRIMHTWRRTSTMHMDMVIGIITTILSVIIITILAITSIRRVNHIKKNNYTSLRQILKDKHV